MVCEPNVELKVYNWTIIQSHSNEKRANETSRMPKCRASLWKLREEFEKQWKATSEDWKWSFKSNKISIPIMGWLKTMKSIKYLVLLVFLINGNQSIQATATASSIADGATASVNKNNSSSTTTATTSTESSPITSSNRERSTKVSSDRAKGKKNFSHSIYIMKHHTIGWWWMQLKMDECWKFNSDTVW